VSALDLVPTVPAAGAREPGARLLRLWHRGMSWAVADGSVREVAGTERLQRNPRATAGWPYGWLLGERDEVPVFLLPGEEPATGSAVVAGGGVVVVLESAAGPLCGLIVDGVEEVREEPIARLRPLPAPAASRSWAFPRVVLWDDGLALEIAPEAVPHFAAGGGETWRQPAGVPPAAGDGETPQGVGALSAGGGGGETSPRDSSGTLAPGGGESDRAGAAPATGAARLLAPVPRGSSAAGLFVFTLPGFPALGFGLPAAQVVEVMSLPEPRPVPGVPEPFLGLHAWRGEPLPVLDLACAVGLPAPAAGAVGFSRGLVARVARSRQLLVFPVEGTTGLRRGPFPHAASGGPPFAGARNILGAFANLGRVLVIPDLDGALRTFPADPGTAGAPAGGR
jgi:chemotaxis signal transduction protein